MTPLQTKVEIALAQAKCRESSLIAPTLSGDSKLRAWNKAFPFAIPRESSPSGSLRLSIYDASKQICICDSGGFLTLIDSNDLETLLKLLRLEAAQTGAVRQLLTGKPLRITRTPTSSKISPEPKLSLTLSDLGLKGDLK